MTTGPVVVRRTPYPTSTIHRAPASTAAREGVVDPSHVAWKTVSGIKAGDRPLLVWIADPRLHADAERRGFDDADVRLAVRAFRRVRISPADARAEPRLAAYVRSTPALVAFAPDLSSASVVDGATIDPRAVLAATRPLASTHLHLDLDASILRARTLLAEERALTDERAALAATSGPVADPAGRAARIAEIDARLARIPELVDGLFLATPLTERLATTATARRD